MYQLFVRIVVVDYYRYYSHVFYAQQSLLELEKYKSSVLCVTISILFNMLQCEHEQRVIFVSTFDC